MERWPEEKVLSSWDTTGLEYWIRMNLEMFNERIPDLVEKSGWTREEILQAVMNDHYRQLLS